MNVEQMTNEELAQYLTLHHTNYQKLTYEEWQELDAEAARRLRNSIPKPVVEVKEAGDGDAELWVNAEFIIVASRARVKVIHDQLNDALGLEGGGDE